MKHWILSAFLGLFLLEVFSLFPYRAPLSLPTEAPNYLSGLINVHSNLSDGSLSIPDLSVLAQQNGHSFVVFSDQDSIEGRRLDLEKNYNGLDAFIELETTTPSGDLLVFFSHTNFANSSAQELSKLSYQRFLGEQPKSSLFVSISHPSHIKKPWSRLDRFPDGMEVVNFDSLFWRKLYSNPVDFLGLALLYPLNPFTTALRVIQPYPKDIATWDSMNSLEAGHFGFLSSQFKRKLYLPEVNISWPTYRELFRMGSNVIFLKEKLSTTFSERKNQIYRAIKSGNLAMIFQSIHPFDGNDFLLKCPQGVYRSGEIFEGDRNQCEFIVKTPASLPYTALIRLFRNGELQKEISSSESEVHIPVSGSGQFRAEIMVRPHTAFWVLLRKWVPYVLYNPIFIS